MKITRHWHMPNKNTFDIKPIKEFIQRNLEGVSVDPFANKNRLATYTNDIDPAMNCNYQLDAIDFLRLFDDASIDVVLFDPPYSPRQVAECYRNLGRTVNMQTTQSSFWGNLKKEVSRVCKPGGKVTTCGWNSGGIGKNLGFEIEEILLVPHGGWHNDTIVTLDRRVDLQKKKL